MCSSSHVYRTQDGFLLCRTLVLGPTIYLFPCMENNMKHKTQTCVPELADQEVILIVMPLRISQPVICPLWY